MNTSTPNIIKIKEGLFPQTINYNNNGVGIVVGHTGAGKTTLVNNICGTTYAAGSARSSISRYLYRHTNSIGKGQFEIIDTPGVGSREEQYKHTYLLKSALTTSPINTIFVILKYDNRFDNIKADFGLMWGALEDYQQKMVVMISHWDLSKDPKSDSEEIIALFKKCCQNIIFYSENSDFNEISNTMYDFIEVMEPQQLKFDTAEFFINFNVHEVQWNMRKDHNKHCLDIKKLQGDFHDLLSACSTLPSEEKDDFLHSLIVAFKDQMEDIKNKYYNKYKVKMVELDYYIWWISLEQECVTITTSFTQAVSKMMSYNLNDNMDPRNLIKRCPNCHEIWFKTEGCDGATTCGAIVSRFHDILLKPWTRFKFIRTDDGSFSWEKVPMERITQVPTKENSLKGVGCQKQFVWKEQPKVEESKILELFQAKTLDEVKESFRNGGFKKFRERYERTIDTRFYS